MRVARRARSVCQIIITRGGRIAWLVLVLLQPLLDQDHLLLVLLGQVLGQALGRKLCLTNVPEIFRQVEGLVLDQRGKQGHVGRLPPAGGQV